MPDNVISLVSKLPPIEIQAYAVSDFAFKTNFDGGKKLSKDYQRSDLSILSSVYRNGEDNSLWQIRLDISVKEECASKYAYDWSIGVMGVFKSNLPKELSDDDDAIFNHVYAGGLGILYSSAREQLRSFSSAGTYGAFLIPTKSFYKVEEGKSKE